MASCDMCSKQATTKARIEGVVLSVCASCAAFGQEFKPPVVPVLTRRTPSSLKDEEGGMVLAGDAGSRLRKARQRMGLNEKDAALKLNLKESTLLHFESGKLQPDDAAIRKLERFYSMTLREQA